MKIAIVLLLFLSSLLFAATAVMQAIMGHLFYMGVAIVMSAILSALSGMTARAT